MRTTSSTAGDGQLRVGSLERAIRNFFTGSRLSPAPQALPPSGQRAQLPPAPPLPAAKPPAAPRTALRGLLDSPLQEVSLADVVSDLHLVLSGSQVARPAALAYQQVFQLILVDLHSSTAQCRAAQPSAARHGYPGQVLYCPTEQAGSASAWPRLGQRPAAPTSGGAPACPLLAWAQPSGAPTAALPMLKLSAEPASKLHAGRPGLLTSTRLQLRECLKMRPAASCRTLSSSRAAKRRSNMRGARPRSGPPASTPAPSSLPGPRMVYVLPEPVCSGGGGAGCRSELL